MGVVVFIDKQRPLLMTSLRRGYDFFTSGVDWLTLFLCLNNMENKHLLVLHISGQKCYILYL